MSAIPAVMNTLGRVAAGILQGLGLLKPNEDPEDFGDRALQAANAPDPIVPEKFANFDEYMDALRNFEPDPEVSKKYTPQQKMVAGLGVATQALEKKYNAEPGSLDAMWLLPAANPDYFTADRMQNLVSTGRMGGDIWAYLEKKLHAGDAEKLETQWAVNLDGSPMNDAQLGEYYQALDKTQDQFSALVKKADDALAQNNSSNVGV